jgi:hypothetical protein
MEHLFLANRKAAFAGYLIAESITNTAFQGMGRGWF